MLWALGGSKGPPHYIAVAVRDGVGDDLTGRVCVVAAADGELMVRYSPTPTTSYSPVELETGMQTTYCERCGVGGAVFHNVSRFG